MMLFVALCILSCDFLIYFLYQLTYRERYRERARRVQRRGRGPYATPSGIYVISGRKPHSSHPAGREVA